jgi:hypothetical protein
LGHAQFFPPVHHHERIASTHIDDVRPRNSPSDSRKTGILPVKEKRFNPATEFPAEMTPDRPDITFVVRAGGGKKEKAGMLLARKPDDFPADGCHFRLRRPKSQVAAADSHDFLH